MGDKDWREYIRQKAREDMRPKAATKQLSDDTLAKMVEERALRLEELKHKANQIPTDQPLLRAKLAREAKDAEWAWAELETERRKRQEARELQKIVDKTEQVEVQRRELWEKRQHSTGHLTNPRPPGHY